MTNYYITANQTSLSTANGDNTFVAPGVVINYGIDMRGNNGGSQTVTLYGTLFDSIDDYFGTSSGDDQIFIGSTGSVSLYWFGAVDLAGGGNIIVNAGTISAMSYGNAIYLLGSVGADQTAADVITNTGIISGASLHPERTWADATIYVGSAAGVTVTNSGSILSSTGYAMSLNAGNVSVTNTGLIQGGVRLGSGSNFFDSRQGTITGAIDGDSGTSNIIYGSKGDDTITGGAGNDFIDGFTGADAMAGGAGDDTYVVDNAGDVVTEAPGAGTDTVKTTLASYTLTANVENLTFTGSGNFAGTGNGLDNVITGGGGNDTLNGGAGNDTLDGGAGADTMAGGAGNDTYIVDNVGDVVTELPGEGTDTVRTTLASYTLGANVENLTFIGSGNFAGTGNTLNNAITGGAGNDTLSGGAGNDTLSGGAGNDTLSGGSGNDTLSGGSGNDMLSGGAGNDSLTGGAGHDSFLFDTALNATTNVDHIFDFSSVNDEILLSHSVFTAAGGLGTLAAAAFVIGAAATTAADRIIYNSTTGALIYDSNGNVAGGATQFARLATGLAPTHLNFQIV